MKTLLLLRHAKSSWKDSALKDFDRPLNKRGLKAAPLIGKAMRKRKLQPDLIVSSTATRASQTTELVIEAGALTGELRYDERIYEASTVRLFEIICGIDKPVNSVMLVGHNPGFEELVAVLTDENSRMKTATLAVIELKVDDWNEARAGKGKLKWLIEAKSLMKDE
jgi:phosphohistidine phosphatase